MAQSLGELKQNRNTWKDREVFRHNRWSYWYHQKARLTVKLRLKQRAKWWALYVEARDKRAWYDHEIAKREYKAPQTGSAIMDGKVIAAWIAPRLVWYRQHGWTGYIVSGYRSYAKQAELYNLYKYHGGNIAAKPGTSNHNFLEYPHGAVDVTNYSQLAEVIRHHPYPGGHNLVWAGPTIGDYVHFSSEGH